MMATLINKDIVKNINLSILSVMPSEWPVLAHPASGTRSASERFALLPDLLYLLRRILK